MYRPVQLPGYDSAQPSVWSVPPHTATDRAVTADLLQEGTERQGGGQTSQMGEGNSLHSALPYTSGNKKVYNLLFLIFIFRALSYLF